MVRTFIVMSSILREVNAFAVHSSVCHENITNKFVNKHKIYSIQVAKEDLFVIRTASKELFERESLECRQSESLTYFPFEHFQMHFLYHNRYHFVAAFKFLFTREYFVKVKIIPKPYTAVNNV